MSASDKNLPYMHLVMNFLKKKATELIQHLVKPIEANEFLRFLHAACSTAFLALWRGDHATQGQVQCPRSRDPWKCPYWSGLEMGGSDSANGRQERDS